MNQTAAKKVKSPRVGRPAGRFTQHRRIDKLKDLLESEPRGLTLAEIARKLRVSERSVRRYLIELDGTSNPGEFELLESVPTQPGGPHRWRIRPSERGRAVALRRTQASALVAMRRALDVLKGSALFDEIDLAMSQIAKIAQTPFRTQGAQIVGERGLEERFLWLPSIARNYSARGEDLDELFRAVAELRVLRFRPRTPRERERDRTRDGETRASRIVFHPYAMVIHKGSVLVIGTARDAESPLDVQILPIETITELRSSETERFTIPTGFDISDYVHGEFGLAPPSAKRALIEFDARSAEDVRAKRVHRDQRIAVSADGRLRLSVPLANPDALISWVMSFGDAARLIEPPELVARLKAILRRAAARYDD